MKISAAYLVREALDIFFPGLCVTCGKNAGKEKYICSRCRETLLLGGLKKTVYRNRENLHRLYYLYHYDYYKGIELGAAVRELKYAGRTGLARELGMLLAETASRLTDFITADVVTGIPLHPARRRERGFNQSQLVAERLAEGLGLEYMKTLERITNTASQAELSSRLRELNVRGVFRVGPDADIAGKTIILLDDQSTTGATLDNAAGALYGAGAEIVLPLSITH